MLNMVDRCSTWWTHAQHGEASHRHMSQRQTSMSQRQTSKPHQKSKQAAIPSSKALLDEVRLADGGGSGLDGALASLQPCLHRCTLHGGHVLLCNLLHQNSAANQHITNMLVSQIWPAVYQPKKQCSCLEPVLVTALEQQLVLSMSQSVSTLLSTSPRLQLKHDRVELAVEAG